MWLDVTPTRHSSSNRPTTSPTPPTYAEVSLRWYSAAEEALLPELVANNKFNTLLRSLSGGELANFSDYHLILDI
jgi:hypothetical protein